MLANDGTVYTLQQLTEAANAMKKYNSIFYKLYLPRIFIIAMLFYIFDTLLSSSKTIQFSRVFLVMFLMLSSYRLGSEIGVNQLKSNLTKLSQDNDSTFSLRQLENVRKQLCLWAPLLFGMPLLLAIISITKHLFPPILNYNLPIVDISPKEFICLACVFFSTFGLRGLINSVTDVSNLVKDPNTRFNYDFGNLMVFFRRHVQNFGQNQIIDRQHEP